MMSAAVLAVGAWIIYNHDKNIDISETIYQSIDEGAKSEYEDRRLGTDAYDYDLDKAKNGNNIQKESE